VVAGTIAAGKTTLTQALSKALELPAFTERPQANPFLKRFYADPKRWALLSQLWFVSDTARQHVEIHERGGAVQDHSVYENVYVFGATLAAEGKLQDDEWELLQEAANSIIACLPPPALVLLVEAPVENLLERIAARARPYEVAIDAGYLEALTAKRREFFAHWSVSPVLLIDSAVMDLRVQHQTDIIAAAVNEYLLIR
jgi:deoxyadenosine/deoxycytidine kinase